MKKVRIYILCVILAFTLAGNQAFASKIKKKNGQVVEGEISGVIVQKELKKTNEGHSARYYPINGADIEAIDEGGVHLIKGSPSVMYEVGPTDKLPSDIEVLQLAMSEGPMREDPLGVRTDRATGVTVKAIRENEVDIKSFFSKSLNAYSGFTIKHAGERSISRGALLSTARMEKAEMVSLNPALQIKTDKGVVTVPLGEIIGFKKEN